MAPRLSVALLRRADPELARRLAECEAERDELLREVQMARREMAWMRQTTRAIRKDTSRLSQIAERHGISL